MVLELRLSVLCGRLTYTSLTEWFCVTEVESVYCAVRNGPFYKTDIFSP